MSREKRIDQEIFDVLSRKFAAGKGVKRHEIKQKNGFAKSTDYIHSKATYRTYRNQGKQFARWARSKGISRLREVRKEHVAQWLEERLNLGDSPFTLKTRGATMAKILGCSSTEFGFDFPRRNNEAVKRSRNPVKMDERLDPMKHAHILTIAKGSGMRRHELQKVRKGQLVRREDRLYIADVKGKGGKVRDIPVLEQYKKEVEAIFQASASERIFPSPIPTHIDIHSYRGEYAKALYDQVLDEMEVRGEEIKLDYRTKGTVRLSLCRAAIRQVSFALGHSRLDVAVNSYLKHHFDQ